MRPLLTVPFLLAAVTATAADKPPPAPEKSAPAPAENATAAAKRDFDDAKAARGLPNATGADVPRLSPPELNLGSGAPTPSASRLDPAAAAKKKPANWLVDAMSDKSKKGAGPETRDKVPGPAEEEKALEPGAAAEKEKPEEKKTAKTETVVNPLERYMASWVSPQDLSLVRSIMREQNPEGGPDPVLAAISAGGAAGASRDVTAPFGTAAAAPGAPTAPRENPFLQLLNTPQPVAGTWVLAGPSTTTSPVPMAMPAVPAPDPAATPKSTIPTFVKPREDEKFNKQMKRF